MDAATKPRIDSDELRFRELVVILWRGRVMILALTAIVIVFAALGAWLTPKTYDASVVMAPVTDSGSMLSGGGALSSVGSQLGGLAALAGLSVAGDSKKWDSLQVLESGALTEAYIKDNNLLPELFHGKWDRTHSRWKESGADYVPTLWKGNQFFKHVRNVSTDSKTGIVTLTISWRSPVLAAAWANGLVAMANEYLRDKAIAETARNVAYLKEQAAQSDFVDVKEGLNFVLVEEIKREMFARGTREYAFKVLDPAEIPEKAASPKKIVWLLVGAFSGFLISSFIVLLRFATTEPAK